MTNFDKVLELWSEYLDSRYCCWVLRRYEMARTKIVGRIFEWDLPRLRLNAPCSCCPEVEQSFKNELVYMSSHSLGGREVVGEAVDYIDDPHQDGGWSGYNPSQATYFWWKSASSGAELIAEREEGGNLWKLTYQGPIKGSTASVWHPESQYLQIFLGSVVEFRIEEGLESIINLFEKAAATPTSA